MSESDGARLAVMETLLINLSNRLIGPDGTVVGMYVFSDLKRISSGQSTHNTDADGRLRVGAAVGVGDDGGERAA